MNGNARDRLLALQDRLLESNTLFIADEVIKQIGECLPQDAKLLFYMRERRRFTDLDQSSEPYLRFPYLSFELCSGNIKRFSTPRELAAREYEIEEEKWNKSESEIAIIHWRDHQELTEDTIDILRRSFLTFYHVCGVREHFVESVSRRFIREFVRSQGSEFSDFARHFAEIRHRLGIEVAVGFQRDMFPRDARDVKQLIEIVPGSSQILDTVSERTGFVKDLHQSISKKSVNFGHIEDLNIYYCINTLTDEHFVVGQGEEETEYRLARRAVLMFLRSDERLPLDGLHNATKLLDSALRERVSVHREDPFFKVLQECQQSEEALGTKPCRTRSQLDKVIDGLLNPFLRDVTYPASLAEQVAVRRYEPTSRTLTLLSSANIPKSAFEPLSVDEPDSLAAAAFRDDRPSWLARERPDDSSDQEDGRRIWLSSIGGPGDALHARPIRVGSVRSGVVEFSGGRSRNLRTEDVYFQRIAATCSEVVRRVELANDRAWLSRMSYVHAARHRIEAVIRDIQESASEQAEQLRKLLSSYSVLDAIVGENPRELLYNRLKAMGGLLPQGDQPALERLCNDIGAMCEEHAASELAFAFVFEVLDTLVSNSSHSPFRAEDVRVSVLASGDGTATLEIIHTPRGALQMTKALEQVCVSPIRDRLPRSSTFHFGLFLLAAQLRMIGGAAMPAPSIDDGLGSSAFGASFMIPLGTPSGGGQP